MQPRWADGGAAEVHGQDRGGCSRGGVRLRCGRGACRQEEGAAEVGRRGCGRGACRQEEGAAEVGRRGCGRGACRQEQGAAEVGRRGAAEVHVGRSRVQPRWADGVRPRCM